jgi:hypothetical protein
VGGLVVIHTLCHLFFKFQFASVVLVLIGNSLFWDLPEGSVNQCSKEVGIEGGVEARDYTPYSYMIMCQAVVTTIIVIAFIRPKLLRSAEDNKRKMSRDSDLDFDSTKM